VSTQTVALIGALTGVVGALTGALSLAWQIIAHRRSGRLVSVTTSYMIPVYGPPHAPEFRDDDQVAVTVSNRGGAPVTVLNYGVAMGRRSNGTNIFWWTATRPRHNCPQSWSLGVNRSRLQFRWPSSGRLTGSAASPTARCASGWAWAMADGSTPEGPFR